MQGSGVTVTVVDDTYGERNLSLVICRQFSNKICYVYSPFKQSNDVHLLKDNILKKSPLPPSEGGSSKNEKRRNMSKKNGKVERNAENYEKSGHVGGGGGEGYVR